MPEQTSRTLSHFAFYQFNSSLYTLPPPDREDQLGKMHTALTANSPAVQLYQLYPAHADADILVWNSISVADPGLARSFFATVARQTNPLRHYLRPVHTLWGFTRPSEYTKARSTQEIDPFASERKPYLIIYPFVKTTEWYLMGREARQGMMNEHIRIGKGFPEITQLLLYSFGLQDQEFIVVYETADLAQFSDLVYELRSSEGRRYTLRDTPLYTATYHPPQETLGLWA